MVSSERALEACLRRPTITSAPPAHVTCNKSQNVRLTLAVNTRPIKCLGVLSKSESHANPPGQKIHWVCREMWGQPQYRWLTNIKKEVLKLRAGGKGLPPPQPRSTRCIWLKSVPWAATNPGGEGNSFPLLRAAQRSRARSPRQCPRSSGAAAAQDLPVAPIERKCAQPLRHKKRDIYGESFNVLL